MSKDVCTKCWKSEYIIVARWDWEWFHHSKWEVMVAICDMCFNLMEWWDDVEWYYMKQKDFTN